jgi:NADH-quinone oxidoreductase subunit J
MTASYISIDACLLVVMIVAVLWTVMGRSLLKATIGLAVTSAVITILMFRLNSPLAAVFELSVCTGLITVVFVSTISLTKPMTHKEIVASSKERNKRFGYLPILMIVTSVILTLIKIKNNITMPPGPNAATDVRYVMWNMRQLDMIGQIIVVIIGALGVVILFEERRRDEW